METRIDEIGEGIYRLSTFAPAIAPPAGFTFNSFLIRDEEPLLFHCGLRKMFPLVSAAVARIIPIESLALSGGAQGMAPNIAAISRETDEIARDDYLYTQTRVVVTYLRGARAGIYTFTGGRLTSVEAVPEQPAQPKSAKPKPKKKSA